MRARFLTGPPPCPAPCAGEEVCAQVLSRGGGATDWAQLLEPLPFFEGFKHFLQARTDAAR